MKRVFYAILGLFQHYSALKKVPKVASVLSLTPEYLRAKRVRVLVLDFDGVLSAHGEMEPSIFVQEWLKKIINMKELSDIFILTNNPKVEREAFFKTHFPSLSFVQGDRKKPYPDGLLKILDQTQGRPEEILLVDDRLLTGILAAQKAGVESVWVTSPWMNFKNRPVTELFFWFLRSIEKIFIF